MIVVRVELWSAVTGEKTELARMHICNEGGTNTLCDYSATTFRGRDAESLAKLSPMRTGKVIRHPRLQQHIWNLVRKSLVAVGYDK